jgi:hypothetical protein
MQLPAAADPSKPLGWTNYTWDNSTFGWEAPPCAGAVGKGLRVTGGMGVWGAALDFSSVPASARRLDGSLLLKVGLTFFAQHMRPASQLVVYLSGASLPGQVAGWTTHELPWQVDICGAGAQSITIGDILLPPAAQRPRGAQDGAGGKVSLEIRLNDGPMVEADQPPTSVWFTSAEVCIW